MVRNFGRVGRGKVGVRRLQKDEGEKGQGIKVVAFRFNMVTIIDS